MPNYKRLSLKNDVSKHLSPIRDRKRGRSPFSVAFLCTRQIAHNLRAIKRRVMLPVFGVRVSVTFHLTCAHIILVRFRLLSGHLLGNSCSLG